MKKLLIICILILLCAGCGEQEFDEPADEPVSMTPTLTIAELQAFHSSGLAALPEGTIGGTVTASDASGNFHRSFIVEDRTGAVEVMAGLYDLHALHPEGRSVYVSLKGLVLGVSDGVYQLGLDEGYRAGYLNHPALLDRHVLRGPKGTPLQGAVVTIPQLSDERVGRLVTIRGLLLGGAGTTSWATLAVDSFTGYPLEKEVRATDLQGNRVYITTSGYADFSGETIPEGPVNITGIVLKEGANYRLKMRDLRDVETL
jgi:hypothetical protein